jgi:hypothetical protein
VAIVVAGVEVPGAGCGGAGGPVVVIGGWGAGAVSGAVEGPEAAIMVAGAEVPAFLATANGSTLPVVGLRTVHIAAVAASLVAMFRPASNAFFRGGAGRSGVG